jgi:hypothetical protein
MPKVRRANLPPALLQHLLDRIQQRSISADQLGLLAVWLDTVPEVAPIALLRVAVGNSVPRSCHSTPRKRIIQSSNGYPSPFSVDPPNGR